MKAPTRGSNFLDLIFTLNIPTCSTSIGPVFPGSDHRIIIACLQLKAQQYPSYKTYRTLSKINWKDFQTLIRSQGWDDFFLDSDIDVAVNNFNQNMLYALDVLAPRVIKDVTKSKVSKCPYSKALRKKICRLKHSFKLALDPSLLHRIATITEKLSREKQFLSTRAETEAMKQPNKTVSLISLLNSRSPSSSETPAFIKTSDNTIITDKFTISNKFNEFFASTLAIESYPLPQISIRPANSLNTVEFRLEDITKILKLLKPSNYLGPDGIPAVVYKSGGEDIPLLLLNIFTNSLNSGVYPSFWKLSHIIPHHKTGPRHHVSNYRPIHHTPVISRIMEKIIKSAVLEFASQQNFFNPSQHGFLSRKSCATCLTSFFDHVTKEFDVGKCVIVIYLDMYKAFDQVPHNRLALKLENLGISDPLLTWLKSFLSNRLQSVDINSCISSSLPITSGVIQGSVLGPLLFLIYINDFSSILQTGTPFLFADDCKLVFSFPAHQKVMYIKLIQQDLQAISEWSKIWLLPFSVNKCSVLPIRCTIPAGTLKLLESDIPITSCVRDLGVLYSNSLNFSEFVHKQTTRAKQMLARINMNIHDKQAKLILYKTCVRPGLEYASFLHSNLKVVDKHKLESLQRSFTKRLICDNESLSYRERCV
ncbi:MAG: RNA-directed DNA polymerase, partial [Lactococcus garvieae]